MFRSTVAVLALALPMTSLVAQQRRASVEVVADLHGAMPTGVTVAANGRIFLNYPQWGDNAPFTVGELKNGKVTAYPDAATNDVAGGAARDRFVSVQSVVADGANRLWVLDTGAPGFAAPVVGGAKLVAVDLATNRVVKTLVLDQPDVVLPTTYLNDVRLDLRQGAQGVAYITDSSMTGPGGLIVVDLATDTAARRLSGHPTTMPDRGFVASVEGQPVMNRPAGAAPSPWLVATDGIAISPDGATLYYCALSSRRFYGVPTALLRDPAKTDADIAAAIVDLGPKAPSDGLSEDAAGNLYAGDYENGTIRRFSAGRWTTIAQDPRILWPDTLSIGTDGWLYFTANQLHRQANFHGGRDLRRQPYQLLRVKVGSGPVLLK